MKENKIDALLMTEKDQAKWELDTEKVFISQLSLSLDNEKEFFKTIEEYIQSKNFN